MGSNQILLYVGTSHGPQHDVVPLEASIVLAAVAVVLKGIREGGGYMEACVVQGLVGTTVCGLILK